MEKHYGSGDGKGQRIMNPETIIEVGENMKMVVRRFIHSGMSMEETSRRMDVSVSDLEKLLQS